MLLRAVRMAGYVEEVDWDGNVLWRYSSSSFYDQMRSTNVYLTRAPELLKCYLTLAVYLTDVAVSNTC